MNYADEPTAEGKRRYPETGGFLIELREPIPCTCLETCEPLCAGECRCLACGVLFAIFCGEVGFYPESKEELEQAIWRYRGKSTDRH